MCEVIFLSLLNEYNKMWYHSWLQKKERAYQLTSQKIPEGKVLQRNKLMVKCSFTNLHLKLIDCSNVSMFVRLQISFWNNCSRNTGNWNTSFWNTSFRNTCNWNTELIFVTNISPIIFEGKKLSCGEISAIHVWQLWRNLLSFIAIYAIFC